MAQPLRVGTSRALDDADELDADDPVELAGMHRELHGLVPNLKAMGGYYGTNHDHIELISRACMPAVARRSRRQ